MNGNIIKHQSDLWNNQIGALMSQQHSHKCSRKDLNKKLLHFSHTKPHTLWTFEPMQHVILSSSNLIENSIKIPEKILLQIFSGLKHLFACSLTVFILAFFMHLCFYIMLMIIFICRDVMHFILYCVVIHFFTNLENND